MLKHDKLGEIDAFFIVAFDSPGGWGFRFCMHKSKNIGGALQNQKHVI